MQLEIIKKIEWAPIIQLIQEITRPIKEDKEYHPKIYDYVPENFFSLIEEGLKKRFNFF